MATTVRSTALSSNIWTTNEQPVDMYSKMFENYPGLTPFLAINTKIGSQETANSRIDWTEQEELPTQVRSSAAATSGASTLTMADDYSYLCNHDFLWNPRTYEVVKVQDTSIDSSVSVIRGWGGTTGAAVLAGDVWEILSSSYHEASEEYNARQPLNSNFYNYTDETMEFVKTSKRVMNERSFFAGKGGKHLENQQKMLRAFKRKMESNLWFSYRSDTVSTQSGYTSNYIKTMGGLVEKLYNGTNFMDVNGILTESILDNWLVDLYTAMPDSTRLACFCSPYVYKIINSLAKPLIRLSPNSKEYGLNLRQYQGAVNLDLIPDPVFQGPTMKGWMFVIDMDYVKLVYQQRPMLELNVGPAYAGYRLDKYSAMYSLIVANEKRHGMVIGIQG